VSSVGSVAYVRTWCADVIARAEGWKVDISDPPSDRRGLTARFEGPIGLVQVCIWHSGALEWAIGRWNGEVEVRHATVHDASELRSALDGIEREMLALR
jgi:hypothetical protein